MSDPFWNFNLQNSIPNDILLKSDQVIIVKKTIDIDVSIEN